MIQRISLLLLAGLLVWLAAGCSPGGGAGASAAGPGAKYHCPMHPTYVSDRLGDCPICGMRLVPIKQGGETARDTAARGDAGPEVPGRTAIMVPADKRQLIGLTTSVVEERPFRRTLRTTGAIEHDETRWAKVAPRFGGWVRTLYVNATGQPVRQGEPMFSVYSPELFQAQTEYLLAWKNHQRLAGSPPAERQAAWGLVQSARRRLELLELDEAEIKALEQREAPADEVLIRAPFSGHVVTRNAAAGQAFAAGETLYEIADLDHLWVRATLSESEMPEVKVGQDAALVFPQLGGKTVASRVSFIYPHIDPASRRGAVRLELENPGQVLRPDMWAQVEIGIDPGPLLAVPASALIDTGTRHVAFVDRADGHLEPREVKVGARTEDLVQVLEGLKAGERVVTRALFLIDSESQLKAALAGLGAAGEHSH
ncbi:MAG TPA: efflux RND transporter periplasmic adaptor subunit [Verrucomicrobiota bacterium]|jgi:Cu(I)/Ag(I) efflux system membrane fusion protein|nr:efflux RND transporter periplasmic adaptor subunit [Verrucomicrobiota bacterium]